MEKHSIKKILVPIDFSETSEAATANAIILAQLLKAEVILIHIIENNWNQFSILLQEQIMPPSIQDIEKAIEKKMNALQKKISKTSGIIPEVFITTGNIHFEIVKFSEEKKVDLIVMGTHGMSGYNEMFIGSNAQRVVTLSEVPVLTMQKKYSKPEFKNILIPIDNSTHSREKVNLAVIIANLFGAFIHILGLPDTKDKLEINKFDTKIKSVEDFFNSAGLKNKTTIVRGDNLGKAAITYATKNKCDLIIINTGHESKINDVFLSAFVQQIVNHSKIPVLSFKHSRNSFSLDTPGFGID